MNTNEDFKEIYETYLRFSIRIAKQIVKDHAAAEDICQEVFYHLYSISESIDISDERKLRSLIAVATANKARDYLKKNYIKREVCSSRDEELESGETGESLEEIILEKEDTEYKRFLMQKLREKNQLNYEILIKVKYLGISPDDVAREYGITRNNVNNRILRTKLWLRKELFLMRDN